MRLQIVCLSGECLLVACIHSIMKYEVTPYSITGDVVTDVLAIFVLIVDDTTPPFTSEYVIENGIFQGKFVKGSKWSVPVDKYYNFPGAIYIVGVYNHNTCFTSPIYINLPLYSCSFVDLDPS